MYELHYFMKITNEKDFFSGMLFIVLGAIFAIASTGYEYGSTDNMGPGYFPLMLGVLLSIIGIIISTKAVVISTNDNDKVGAIVWRPMIGITAANLIFALLLVDFGLNIAVFVLIFTASLAGDRFKITESLVLAAVLTVISYFIFCLLLRLPVQAWPYFITG